MTSKIFVVVKYLIGRTFQNPDTSCFYLENLKLEMWASSFGQVANESESKPFRWRWVKESNPAFFKVKDIGRCSFVLKGRLKDKNTFPVWTPGIYKLEKGRKACRECETLLKDGTWHSLYQQILDFQTS